ncbi:restriction endonuclease [Streptomyces sp. NPDC005811]|uniref:restriction endonuclease n=1 Tax=Streptomyces sp. NPDC005811 TaxID=3154565 RepID=UPI00340E4ACD
MSVGSEPAPSVLRSRARVVGRRTAPRSPRAGRTSRGRPSGDQPARRATGSAKPRRVGGASDLGADVTVWDGDDRLVILQCKQYPSPVGSVHVQQFNGIVGSHHGADARHDRVVRLHAASDGLRPRHALLLVSRRELRLWAHGSTITTSWASRVRRSVRTTRVCCLAQATDPDSQVRVLVHGWVVPEANQSWSVDSAPSGRSLMNTTARLRWAREQHT